MDFSLKLEAWMEKSILTRFYLNWKEIIPVCQMSIHYGMGNKLCKEFKKTDMELIWKYFDFTITLLGLLIEPSLNYSTLRRRNRKVYSVNACLATKNTPHLVEFLSYGAIGGVKGNPSI